MATLAPMLRDNIAQAPDRTAIVLQHARQPDRPLTYGDLGAGAAGYAQADAAARPRPGVVVLILQHGEALVHSYFGSVLYGAVPSIMPFLTEKLAPERYREELASLV